MSTEMVALDVAKLAKLQAMAYEQDSDASAPKVPIVKINYEADSKIPRGTWVIGQERNKEGEIVNEGRVVKGFVILDTYNRYNLYNQTDQNLNCSSPMHKRGDEVRGHKFGYVCGKTCPKRDKETMGQNACKAQLVPVGMAVTEDNELIFARIFIQGASYMSFSEYLETSRSFMSDGRQWKLPTYAYMTLLSSEKKKNGAATYFEARFTRGPIFDMEQIEKFSGQIDKVEEVVGQLNDALTKTSDKKKSSSPAASVAATVKESVIDVTPHAKTMTAEAIDVPWQADAAPKVAKADIKSTDASLDFNIEDAINKALGGI